MKVNDEAVKAALNRACNLLNLHESFTPYEVHLDDAKHLMVLAKKSEELASQIVDSQEFSLVKCLYELARPPAHRKGYCDSNNCPRCNWDHWEKELKAHKARPR